MIFIICKAILNTRNYFIVINALKITIVIRAKYI
jgi:hypothetical protein